jgi:hypothetical protein
VGCLPDCVAVLTLEAYDDNLYNYTILTRGVPERIERGDLGGTSTNRDNENGYGCIG